MKQFRIQIINDLKDIFLKRKHYILNDKKQIDIPMDKVSESIKNTVRYTWEAIKKEYTKWLSEHKTQIDKTPCSIDIINKDCLDVGLDLKEKGFNPAVLNMASATHPGGGYLNGAGAQEEQLFRRTSLFMSLDNPDNKSNKLYPIPSTGGIYVKNALVIAKGEDKNYEFLDEVKYMSFICCAAYRCDQSDLTTNKDKEAIYAKAIVNNLMYTKIDAIFKLALINNHDSIVVSAFGCGAYSNPPLQVAKLFKQVIDDNKYAYLFKKIVFAILDDRNAYNNNVDGNLIPFVEVFTKK